MLIKDVIERVARQIAETSDGALIVPTEVVAEGWRRLLCRYRPSSVLRSDRVLAWDTFKKEALRRSNRPTPANALTRRIYAMRLLNANRRRPLLRAIVPPEYRAHIGSYVSMVGRLLPRLTMMTRNGATLGRDWHDDCAALFQDYQSFLNEYALYEPEWESPTVSSQRRYCILFPEVLRDWEYYRPYLEETPQISHIAVPASQNSPLRVYETFFDELQAVMQSIERLLDTGVMPADIAITVADVIRYAPYLQSAADIRAIPLTMRYERPLIEWPAGVFFAHVARLLRSQWDIEALRDLLLNPLIPWRKPDDLRIIVERCTRNAVLRGWSSIAAVLDPERRRLLHILRDELSGLRDAKNAGDLLAAAGRCGGLFLQVEDWDRSNQRVWQMVLNLLADIAYLERHPGIECEQPFDLFLSLLRDRPYVPEPTEMGIAVYPYLVTAGLAVEHHFVLNLSQAATRVRSSMYDFLNEMQRTRIGYNDLDISNEYHTLYNHSGTNVMLSCSHNTPIGRAVPALIGTPLSTVGTDDDVPRLEVERTFWAGQDLTDQDGSRQSPFPDMLYPSQRQGIEYMAHTGLMEKSIDWSRQRIGHPIIPAKVVFSATSLERLRRCPFDYLMCDVLGIWPPNNERQPDDALHVGTLYHRMLQTLYDEIATRDAHSMPLVWRTTIPWASRLSTI